MPRSIESSNLFFSLLLHTIIITTVIVSVIHGDSSILVTSLPYYTTSSSVSSSVSSSSSRAVIVSNSLWGSSCIRSIRIRGGGTGGGDGTGTTTTSSKNGSSSSITSSSTSVSTDDDDYHIQNNNNNNNSDIYNNTLVIHNKTLNRQNEDEDEDENTSKSENNTTTATTTMIEYVFSDVDGTLVHKPPDTTTHITTSSNKNKNNNNNNNNNNEGQEEETNHNNNSINNNSVLHLPPSSTGMRGIISSKTHQLCQTIRRCSTINTDTDTNDRIVKLKGKMRNVKLILISGMRTSTLLERLPYLPKADAYASESGGRIFYPTAPTRSSSSPDASSSSTSLVSSSSSSSSSLIWPVPFDGATNDDLTPFGLTEDGDWRKLMSREESAGLDGYHADVADAFLTHNTSDDDGTIPLAKRTGALWDFANSLVAQGYVIDCKSYASCFRVDRRQQHRRRRDEDEDGRLIRDEDVDVDVDFDALSSMDVTSIGLASSSNLGCIDFYPIQSGKKNCCAYLAHKFSTITHNSTTTTAIPNNTQQLNQQQQQLSSSSTTTSPEKDLLLLSQRSICLCDDDNDLEMALACWKAYLPSVTSVSMAQAARDFPDRIIVVETRRRKRRRWAGDEGNGSVTLLSPTAATELALEWVLEQIGKTGGGDIVP